MAWLKIETCTPEKPEIKFVARSVGCSIGDAFLAFFRLYRHFDMHCDGQTVTNVTHEALHSGDGDCFLPGFTADDADEESRVKGAGKAFESTGWIQFIQEGVIIKNWERHNGKSSKERALTARRMSEMRAKKPVNGSKSCYADTVTNVTITPSPDKSRVDKSNNKKQEPTAVATLPLVLEVQEQKPKKEPKAEKDRQLAREFFALWCEAYKATTGLTYQKGNYDGKPALELVSGTLTPTELVEIAKRAWGNPTGWNCQKMSRTIKGFYGKFNEIRCELNGGIANPQQPISYAGRQQIDDLRYKINYNPALPGGEMAFRGHNQQDVEDLKRDQAELARLEGKK